MSVLDKPPVTYLHRDAFGGGSKAPWTPAAVAVIGLLFGPVSAAMVTYSNLKRCRRPDKGMVILVGAIILTIVFAYVVINMSEASSNLLGRLIGNIVSPFLFPLLQKSEFDRWTRERSGAKPRSGWAAAGPGIVGFALFLGIVLGVNMVITGEWMFASLGKRLEFNGGEVYYRSGATKEEASSLGRFLVDEGFFDGNPKSVQLRKSDEMYQVRIVVGTDLEIGPAVVRTFGVFAAQISSNVFGEAPVEVHLCDERLTTRRVVSVGEGVVRPLIPGLATPPPDAGGSGTPPPGTYRIYVVRQGDSLSKIAAQFDVSVKELQRLNGLANPNKISVGMRLKIPEKE